MLYEVALCEWGLTPEYINNEWTDEILYLMVEARSERLNPKKTSGLATSHGKHYANPEELLTKMRGLGSTAISVTKVTC